MLKLKPEAMRLTSPPTTHNDHWEIIMSRRIVVQEGDVYGRLTVIREADSRRQPDGRTVRVFTCKCDCGSETNFLLANLRNGHTTTCGCNPSLKTHGMYKHPAYKKWKGMMDRTTERSQDAQKYYDRGIGVCDEWAGDPIAFCAWAEKAGIKAGLELDRIDNNKGYSPDNCRFVSKIANMRNRRCSYWFFIDGDVFESSADASKKLGVHVGMVERRSNVAKYRGWFKIPKYPSAEWLASLQILLHNSDINSAIS